MPFQLSADIADDKDLPFLWLKPAKGAPAAYYRRARVQGHHVVRLRGADGKPVLPGQTGFRSSWERAHREYENSHQATQEAAEANAFGIANLVRSFQASPRWRRIKSEATREAYKRRCRRLTETIDPFANMSTIDRRGVLAIRDVLETGGSKRGHAPATANEGVKMLSLLFEHAIDLGWREGNPAKGIPALETGDGHRAWTEDDVTAVLVHPEIPAAVKVAVATARWSGLRLADLCALARDARRNGVLIHRTQKTGAMVYLPLHPDLARWLDAAPAHTAVTLLANPSGQPWSADHLSHMITDAARRANRTGLSCHGLRKSATIAAAEAGLTDAEIEALVPHADKNMTRYYREQASQKLLAQRAMAKLTGC